MLVIPEAAATLFHNLGEVVHEVNSWKKSWKRFFQFPSRKKLIGMVEHVRGLFRDNRKESQKLYDILAHTHSRQVIHRIKRKSGIDFLRTTYYVFNYENNASKIRINSEGRSFVRLFDWNIFLDTFYLPANVWWKFWYYDGCLEQWKFSGREVGRTEGIRIAAEEVYWKIKQH